MNALPPRTPERDLPDAAAQATSRDDASRRRAEWRRGRAFAALTLAAMPLFLGAGESFEERRQRIEAMTAVERAALEHNYKQYRALAPADRKKYADLDREIQQDKQGLDRVMSSYAEWLKALPIEKREELRSASDATTRMQIVRRLREEQDAQRAAPSQAPAGPIAHFLNRGAPFNAKNLQAEFASMMAIVERRAGIPPEKRKDWESLPPPQRHLRILLLSMRNAEDKEGGRFPDETMIREMIATLPDEQARRRFRDNVRPDQQRQMVGMTLLRGLAAEWQAEIEQRRPSEAELQKFFGALDDRKRADIMRQPREFAEKQILWQYHEQQSGEFANDLKDFRRLMQKFVKDGPRSPGEMHSPQNSPDGDNRPPPPPPREGEPPPERGRGERGPPGERGPFGERRPRPEGSRPDGPRPDGSKPDGPGKPPDRRPN